MTKQFQPLKRFNFKWINVIYFISLGSIAAASSATGGYQIFVSSSFPLELTSTKSGHARVFNWKARTSVDKCDCRRVPVRSTWAWCIVSPSSWHVRDADACELERLNGRKVESPGHKKTDEAPSSLTYVNACCDCDPTSILNRQNILSSP